MRGNSTPIDGLVVEGADIEINLAVTQYSRAFDINGHQAGVLAIRPYGNVSGSVSTDLGTLTDDVLEYRTFRVLPGFPAVAPDQLDLEGFEECLTCRIVATIALAAHRDLEPVL